MKRIIVVILTAALLTGCSNTKHVYKTGNGWNYNPKTSAMTGWKYTK